MRAFRGSIAVLLTVPALGSACGGETVAGAERARAGSAGAGAIMSTAAAAGAEITEGGSGGSAQAGAGGVTEADGGEAGSAAPPPGECADLLGTGHISTWVTPTADGQLGYRSLNARGDRILDFSYAGYEGGGVALPRAAVVATLKPSGADDTAIIQAALDATSKRALSGGLRGAVLLSAGTFKVARTLTISASGVVLRGAGSAANGTKIDISGTPHELLVIAGAGSWQTSNTVHVTDAYVPSGSNTLNVDDASALEVGDSVLVDRPVTSAWVHFMGMDTLVRDGMPQTWLAVGTLMHAERTVAAISGQQLTLDVPLADSYDAKYLSPPGPSVSKYTFAGRISHVGVEGLQVFAPATATPITAAQYQVLDISAAEDCWVSDLTMRETVNSIHLAATTRRITLQDLTLTRTLPADGSAGYPLEITLEGTQNLVQRASMQGDNIYTYSTGARVTGPNVYLNATGSGTHNRAEPHQRWSTGLLADQVSGEAINLFNRATAGSGHGWAIGWSVVWNGQASTLEIEQPPGSQNFAIGCIGKQTASTAPGEFDSLGTHVLPKSLYLAQLCVRRGRAAVSAIGD